MFVILDNESDIPLYMEHLQANFVRVKSEI